MPQSLDELLISKQRIENKLKRKDLGEPKWSKFSKGKDAEQLRGVLIRELETIRNQIKRRRRGQTRP